MIWDDNWCFFHLYPFHMFGITLWVLVMILQELMSIATPSFNIFDRNSPPKSEQRYKPVPKSITACRLPHSHLFNYELHLGRLYINTRRPKGKHPLKKRWTQCHKSTIWGWCIQAPKNDDDLGINYGSQSLPWFTTSLILWQSQASVARTQRWRPQVRDIRRQSDATREESPGNKSKLYPMDPP